MPNRTPAVGDTIRLTGGITATITAITPPAPTLAAAIGDRYTLTGPERAALNDALTARQTTGDPTWAHLGNLT